MQIEDYFLRVRKTDIAKVEYDLTLALWYSALKDYARRFKPDKSGFNRINSALFESDLGVSRMRAWRYNSKLEALGLISLDKAHRGGRTWVGVKILK